MRANEEPDHQNVPGTSSVPVSRDDIQAPAHSPDALLALQRAAGNAAVVRVIQRSRGERPAADAGVGDVLKSPGSPLAPHVRADMESRLGADFSDVQVHTGADARRSARDLGARAYTSGNHVVLGDGGGDQHTLAHELVHVVQQRKGPVAGTDTGTGLRVSDPGDRFEREAEATAHQVMSGAPAHEHDHPQETAHPADQATVQRKVMAQVVAAEGDELTVDSLITAGRPDSPHSGTEGDHTTAYVVLTQAVRRVINGKTAEEAADGVWGLYQEARTLPGAALRPNLDTDRKHAKLLKDAEDELERLHELPDGKQWDMPRLQQLISAYLDYRGTLPLSTLNIKATGKPRGKGTGESARVRPLNRYEAGDHTVSTDAIKDAVLGLMDSDALVTYAIEVETPGSAVAPGTVDGPIGEETVANRLKPVVEQHVASTAQAFPTAVRAAWGSLKAAEDELVEGLKDRARDAKANEVTRLLARLAEVREKGKNTVLAEQYERNLRAYGVTPPPAPTKKLGRGERIKNKSKGILSDVVDSPKKVGKAISSRLRKTDQELEDDVEPEVGDAELDVDEATGARAARPGIATQLVIDDGGTITEMRSAGRAASPFPGTMGAHTTAWIAHVDFIRTRLVHKDVTAAVKELPGLVEHVKRTAQRLEPFQEKEDEVGGLAEDLAGTHIAEPAAPAPDEGGSRVDEATVQAAMVRLVGATTAAAVDKPAGTQAVLLQQAVGAILERLNIIPGVTRYVADTKGSGEGTYRKMLLTGKRGRKKEDMRQKDYQVAIFGLLDVKEDLDHAQRLALMQNHLAVIDGAYPGVLGKAGLSEADPEKALTLWKKRGKDSEDPF
ncbi:eCIS core domain-containing protein [Saccharothrix sp. NRRL B-16348]|uniref:eCIS core domain-containing protein n=1 Tax=Saccharothrix sp. NRRL B-16348 TaxID=1415542 RepID=UPI0007C874C6|nr:DUF4157 domain-containing protein [Saccharothrix sp. NRRL B-16348]